MLKPPKRSRTFFGRAELSFAQSEGIMEGNESRKKKKRKKERKKKSGMEDPEHSVSSLSSLLSDTVGSQECQELS